MLGRDAKPLSLIFPASNINVELMLAGSCSGSSPVFPQSLAGAAAAWPLWSARALGWAFGSVNTGGKVTTELASKLSCLWEFEQTALRRQMAHLLCAYTLIFPQQKAFTQLLQKQFAQKNPWGTLDWFYLYKLQFFNLLFTHKHLY